VKVSGRIDLFARLLLVAVSPIVLIAGLELGAWWMDLQAGFFLGPGNANCLRRSWLLETDFRPHCDGNMSGTKLRTNSLGLRGDEIRDDGSKRILAIGDSCTWGWRVGQDESYPAVLQRLLDERYGAPAYQVINAGVPGYSTYRGLLYLRERGLRLNPAIVIAGYSFNDLSGGGDDEVRIAHNRLVMPLLLVDDFFTESFRFYRWARYSMAVTDARSGDHAKRVPPDKFKRNLAEIVRLSRDHGAKVMLLNFTELRRHIAYKTALVEVAEELDVPLLFYEGPKFDVVHPTAEGHRAFAPQILARLEHEGWLTERSSSGQAAPRR
jgi:lysophospholipase L1-like esterase